MFPQCLLLPADCFLWDRFISVGKIMRSPMCHLDTSVLCNQTDRFLFRICQWELQELQKYNFMNQNQVSHRHIHAGRCPTHGGTSNQAALTYLLVSSSGRKWITNQSWTIGKRATSVCPILGRILHFHLSSITKLTSTRILLKGS